MYKFLVWDIQIFSIFRGKAPRVDRKSPWINARGAIFGPSGVATQDPEAGLAV